MASINGGFVGIDYEPSIETTQAQQITTFNSSGTFTAQPLSTVADVLVIAGGGGGGGQAGNGGPANPGPATAPIAAPAILNAACFACCFAC